MDNTTNPFLVTFRLPVKPSLILHRILAVVHVICLILAWMNDLALIIKVLLSFILIVSSYIYLYKSRRANINNLILNAKDEWQVKMLDGSVYPAVLDSSLFVHPWLTIIFLKYNRHGQYFIFTPENIDADIFRRLRVRLRFKVGN